MANRRRKCLCCGDYDEAVTGVTTPRGWFMNWDHAYKYARDQAAKDRLKRERVESKAKKQDAKQRKEKLKTRRDWMKEAQTAFNAFIRERDKKDPCACCGVSEGDSGKTGGVYDCGHYLSVGAHPQHRFDEANAHKQLKSCNGGSGQYTKKGYTVQQQYRERLITKIGLAEVERLESDHEPKKYTIDDLKAIKAAYKEKLKVLQGMTAQEQQP